MSGVTFDAGALIALERAERSVVALVVRAKARGDAIATPAGVIGQVWRDGRRQARLARFLASPVVHIEPLDDEHARAAGQLCGVAKTNDVIDASVILCAKRREHAIVTSDPDDLRRLDSKTKLVVVEWGSRARGTWLARQGKPRAHF